MLSYQYRKMLHALTENARITTRNLGRTVRKSQQFASYALHAMEKRGITLNYKAVVDPSRFGLINIIVLYNFKMIDKRQQAKLFSHILHHPDIISFEQMSHGTDIMAEYCVPNLSFFNKQHRELLYEWKSILQVSEIYVVIVKHLYERKYLIKKPQFSDIILCGDRENLTMNDHKKRFLNLIHEDGRVPITTIATKMKTDPKTLVAMRKRLERQGVIKKYTAIIDPNRIDLQRRIVLIQPVHEDPEDITKLLAFVKFHRNVIEATKIIGDYEIMLTIEKHASDTDVLEDIRKQFQVLNYKVLESKQTIKKGFIPAEI